jgi:hypothetical protein
MFLVEIDFTVTDEDVQNGSCLYLVECKQGEDAVRQATEDLRKEVDNGHLRGVERAYVVAVVEIMKEPLDPLLLRLKTEEARIAKHRNLVLPNGRQRFARSWKPPGTRASRRMFPIEPALILPKKSAQKPG